MYGFILPISSPNNIFFDFLLKMPLNMPRFKLPPFFVDSFFLLPLLLLVLLMAAKDSTFLSGLLTENFVELGRWPLVCSTRANFGPSSLIELPTGGGDDISLFLSFSLSLLLSFSLYLVLLLLLWRQNKTSSWSFFFFLFVLSFF